jgi:Pyruvate/2-oxoacid:ferredoxin oxidoreductase delta subunit
MKLDRDPLIFQARSFEIELILKQFKIQDVRTLKLLNPLYIDLDNGCWFHNLDWSVYTTINKQRAHRLAWELWTGIKPPINREVCHNCDRRGCFCPDHLFLGTHGDNMQDARNKGRVFNIRLGN